MKVRSVNPSTGELIKEFDSAAEDEVKTAVARARLAQTEWGSLTLEERRPYFDRLAEVMKNNMQKILTLMLEETGKRIPDGEAEVYDVIDAVDYYCSKMAGVKVDCSLQLNPDGFPDTDLEIHYVPHGVVGLIMPWNFPFYSPAMFVIAATVAGNSVILKPSEYSTLVGLEILRQFTEAGFPENLVQVLVGADDTGKLLVKSDVDKLFFVGSVEAGKDIIANAGIKPVQVELGGNSAAIVLKDADLELAINGVSWAGTYHSGQDCVGIKRVFVVEEVAEPFVSGLVNVISNLRPGTDYGPYITAEARDEVERRIAGAIAGGAKLLCGGKRIEDSRGYWLTPSVILYSDESLELVAKETFGNTVPVMTVKDTEMAIEKANSTDYGLSNAVFTKDLKKARYVASRLQSGMVFINEPFIAIPGWDHWTGWKNSGFGTTESKLMQCLKKKVISVNKMGHQRAFWYPYPDHD